MASQLDRIESRLEKAIALMQKIVDVAVPPSEQFPTDQPTDDSSSPTPSEVPMVGPGIVELRGARINLTEPIRADWEPSMMARTLSQGGSFTKDPSNGAEFGLPLRSPSGYPLVYVNATTPGVLKFAEQVFENEAQIAANVAARERSRENMKEWQARFDSEQFNGTTGIPVSQLSAADLTYMHHVADLGRDRLNAQGKGYSDVFRALFTGGNNDMNLAINSKEGRKDVAKERQAFYENPEGWVRSYIATPRGQVLEKAFHTWLSQQ